MSEEKKLKVAYSETRQLPCVLTPDEMKAKSQKLVEQELERTKQETLKKAKVAEMNAGLKLVKEEITELVQQLDSGTEKRDVECEKRLDFQNELSIWVRTDTQEVLSEAPMDPWDKQEMLNLDGASEELPVPAKPQKRTRKSKSQSIPDALMD